MNWVDLNREFFSKGINGFHSNYEEYIYNLETAAKTYVYEEFKKISDAIDSKLRKIRRVPRFRSIYSYNDIVCLFDNRNKLIKLFDAVNFGHELIAFMDEMQKLEDKYIEEHRMKYYEWLNENYTYILDNIRVCTKSIKEDGFEATREAVFQLALKAYAEELGLDDDVFDEFNLTVNDINDIINLDGKLQKLNDAEYIKLCEEYQSIDLSKPIYKTHKCSIIKKMRDLNINHIYILYYRRYSPDEPEDMDYHMADTDRERDAIITMNEEDFEQYEKEYKHMRDIINMDITKGLDEEQRYFSYLKEKKLLKKKYGFE